MTSLAPTKPLRLNGYLLAASLGVLALFLFSFTIGPYPIPASTVVSVFLHRLDLVEKTWSDAVELVVLDVRGPRIAAAILVGGALASAGATYQNLFRNPLVSPGVLGVSSGAGFGAALGILLGMPGFGVQGLAFVLGLVAVALTVWLGRSFDRRATLVLVVAGLVVSAFFQALISLIKIVADPLNQLPTITFWLLGGLHRMSAASLVTALIPIAIAGFVLHALRWKVNTLAAGEDEARTMGVDVPKVRLLLILAATMMTAACVAISGIVGWVGLLIPHIVRMLVGPSFAAVLPLSALIGGGFLLGIDNLARLPGTTEIPLGILTALIGAPFFALILARTRRQWF
ncbi:MAG: iron ABC transporter permease [Alphaproteobacteria bacterium]|nr:iron ABC transporter permease [Alphaproteobacteria bacterium]